MSLGVYEALVRYFEHTVCGHILASHVHHVWFVDLAAIKSWRETSCVATSVRDSHVTPTAPS